MRIELNQKNFLDIDEQNGGKILQLVLAGVKIIKSDESNDFLGSGSYLMFPWVNRITQNPYQKLIKNQFFDGKGYPLHGLFANTKRQIKIQQNLKDNQQKSVIVHIINSSSQQQIHSFTQTFTLSQGQLTIKFSVIQSKLDSNPFCFGYHPYFQLSKKLPELKISTNLKSQLKLKEDLLAEWPQKQVQWNRVISGNQKYDSLFKGLYLSDEKELSNYVELNDGVNSLKVQSNLKYWQIYTPPDGKRIAIEPMSFHANLYEIAKTSPQLMKQLPKQAKIKITVQ